MKVKYLGTLFAASVLSLGLVTSCATPESGEVDGADTTIEVDPCAGTVEVDPCAGAVEVDPCAGTVEVDPCAGQ